jgi:ADP-ribosylglycohydrolase
MIGGGLGPWAPGEWTDDTQMALCIALAIVDDDGSTRAIAERFIDWYSACPKDVGNQTSAVLGAARPGDDLVELAAERFRRDPGGSAGNGSLMRTAPVALARLGDDEGIVSFARAVSELTHGDPKCGDACVLWCIGIDRAIREERLDGVIDGLDYLDASARAGWADLIEDARTQPPERFRPNGYVVGAFQAALAAVWQTQTEASDHVQQALRRAVHIGDDTDTVAAIAGSLLGARWGADAIPPEWLSLLHGWPGLQAGDLERIAIALAGRPTR